MAQDFSNKTDIEINNWIENHENKGATDATLYAELLEERARRNSKFLDVEVTLEHLKSVSKERRFTTYGEVAKANNIAWEKAHLNMSGPGGHLDQVLDVCHARGLPMFTAVCVNQRGVETGKLEETALQGFIKGVRRTGGNIPTNDEAFLKDCQEKCFEWGESN